MPLKLATKILSPGKPGVKMVRLFKAAFKDAQPKISALIVDRVSAEANKQLGSLAPLYNEGLAKPSTVKLTEEGIEVSLGTKVSKAIEDGATAWDIKKAMLAKAKKFSKQGSPYVDVPFRHTTSGASGSTMLPAGVKRAIDAKASQQPAPRPGRTQTTRMPMKTQGKSFTRSLRKSSKDGSVRLVKQRVRHKRGLQDDLVRRRTASSKKGGKGSTTYGTMRRISAKSAVTSWWHPGFKPAGILKKVLPKLKPEITEILKASLAKVKGSK